MKKTAVVILNWNGKDYLERFLPGLLEHTTHPDIELVVADNASTDASVEFVRQTFPGITIIELDSNYGFAGGYNRALSKLKAEFFLLLNSDIEVTRGWWEPLVDFLLQHPDFAAVSPVLLDYHRRDTFEYAGAAGGFIDKYGYTFCRGRIFDHLEKQTEKGSAAEVFWTTGACMLIRREDFRLADGFDDHFFAHMEEVDLCWRLKNAGKRMAVTGRSQVYHVGGGTLPKSNPRKTYLNFRNNLFLLYKNLPASDSGRVIATRLMMDYLSVIRFLFKLAFRDMTAIFRAHRDFFRGVKSIYRGRLNADENRSPGKLYGIYGKSVVVDYFLLGNRTFSKLRGLTINIIEDEYPTSQET